MRSLLRRVRYLLRQRQAHDDLENELAFHQEMKARALESAGADADDARRRARRALGNTSLAHDDVRDVWVPRSLQGISQDFRLGVRLLAATPGISAAAILSLALGIGGTTAIFSLIDGLLLRPLPVRDPGRLVMLTDGGEEHWNDWSYGVWRELRARAHNFDGMLAWANARFDLASGGESQFVNGVRVSGSYFGALGVTPHLGRAIVDSDDVPGGGTDGSVAVLSFDFWQRYFHGDPDVLGRPLTLDRRAFTIVGVAPRGFFGLNVGQAFDVAVPVGDRIPAIGGGAARAAADGPSVSVMARLRPTQTIESATTALRAIQPAIREATLPVGWPQAFLDRYFKTPFFLEPGATGASALRGRFLRPLLAILIMVALVLLVACVNLANLSLARAAGRRRELGMRLALGASTWRIMRQLIAESVLLAASGAAAGLAVASWIAGALTAQLATTVPVKNPNEMTGAVFLDTSIDGRVLAFTVVLTAVTLLLFGTVPAWRASRVAPLDAIVDHRRPGGRRPVWRAADAFIAVQVAVSLTLIAGASLLVRTRTALEMRPLGFDRQGLVIATIDAQPVAQLTAAGRQELYEQVLDAVRGLPEVANAALSFLPPVVNGPMPDQPIQSVSGAAPLPPRGANAAVNLISAGWFHTMKIPLVAGRDIGAGDRLGTPPVMVVNQAFARRFLGNADAIGHTVRLFLPGPPPPPVEIVGVVADNVYGQLRSAFEPTIFLPIPQLSASWMHFLSSVDVTIRPRPERAGSLAKSVAHTITATNAALSLTVHPLADYVDDALVQERLVAWVAGGFAALALLLAAIGLHGVTTYAIARRRSELGIRIALGASAANIVRLTVSRLAASICAGTAAGIAITLWAAKYAASLLYGVEPRDPANLAAAVAVLVAAAVVAAWTPVRKALLTDPVSTIRCT